MCILYKICSIIYTFSLCISCKLLILSCLHDYIQHFILAVLFVCMHFVISFHLAYYVMVPMIYICELSPIIMLDYLEIYISILFEDL